MVTLVLLQDLRTSAGGGSKQTGEIPGLLGSVKIHSSICEDFNTVYVTIFAIVNWGIIYYILSQKS